jgi:hypothetical protein
MLCVPSRPQFGALYLCPLHKLVLRKREMFDIFLITELIVIIFRSQQGKHTMDWKEWNQSDPS